MFFFHAFGFYFSGLKPVAHINLTLVTLTSPHIDCEDDPELYVASERP